MITIYHYTLRKDTPIFDSAQKTYNEKSKSPNNTINKNKKNPALRRLAVLKNKK